ncbi:DinB family protein [Siphonobacter aquaeclarae]|uniref:DinB superfamily protein n=1 Tax=Siphonobacter aquaeclarae TaxID=563176 RepID=A0A1G9SMZ2_9BACT|nr:DinB family protein [Siphonobacter aquaeclarae]SDM36670.1 DinB superfamily protein [Siphonobacter aquaeclarae]
MLDILKEGLRNQLGAAIDMLENAIRRCPGEHWETNQFWYHAFHCLFFLDYYLAEDPPSFTPPLPFDESEFEDRMPDRIYTQEELLDYLDKSRRHCYAQISGLTNEGLTARWINSSGSMNYSRHEILLYNLRHTQHHAAQLNLLLRQTINDAPEWVFRAGEHF